MSNTPAAGNSNPNAAHPNDFTPLGPPDLYVGEDEIAAEMEAAEVRDYTRRVDELTTVIGHTPPTGGVPSELPEGGTGA
jgi:hypothetical protein